MTMETIEQQPEPEPELVAARAWRPGDTPPELRALIEREREEFEALWERRASEGKPADERARQGSRNSSSVMFTLRLPHEDFAKLERQAARRGLKPSVLARNLLRHGLSDTRSFDMVDLVDELTDLLERMRVVAP